MFKINKNTNSIEKLEETTLTNLEYGERDNLQEWIAKKPDAFGEDLLIIQKEFSGWEDTNERLDLLALDKDRRLVIIENKRDDSGKDVTWQALKYTSYCSQLSKQDILNIYQDYLKNDSKDEVAKIKILEFLEAEDENWDNLNLNDGFGQRIFLIATNFRKEVTSTVLWLRNYDIQIECFKVTPYTMQKDGSEVKDEFLDIERIIPLKDTEEFLIKMAKKEREDSNPAIHQLRREFWRKIIDSMCKTESKLFNSIGPGKFSYIHASSGIINGIKFAFVMNTTAARVELYIDRGENSKDENEEIFQQIKKHDRKIEEKFGGKLIWESLPERRACRIKTEIGGNIKDKAQWDNMIEWMTKTMVKFEKVMKPVLKEIPRP